ncbi:MAG: S41 family peptidase [Acidobacteriota bacterium]
MRRAPLLLLILALPSSGCLFHRGAKTSGAAKTGTAPVADVGTATGRRQVLDALIATLEEQYVPAVEGMLLPADRLREARESLTAAGEPARFYAAVNAQLRLSGNRHLYLYAPGHDVFDRPAGETRLVGATSRTVDGFVYVDDIWEGGPADRAGLKYGDQLLPSEDEAPRLDPLPASVKRLTLWVRRTRDAEPTFLSIDSLGGDTLWYLAEATRSSIRTLKAGTCRIGVVHVRTLADKDLVEDLITGAQFNDVDGLILDLRGNAGGEIRLAGELLDLVSRQPSVWITYREQRYPFPATSWNHPLAILVDEKTRSAAEIFAAAIQVRHLGTVIGTPTAGQVQGSRLFPLPDGSRLLVPVTRVSLPDGLPMEGRGVTPDIIVERPLPFAAGRDPVLERARTLLTNQVACPEDLPAETFPQEKLSPERKPDSRGPSRGQMP